MLACLKIEILSMFTASRKAPVGEKVVEIGKKGDN